jgi:hypothetical protein
MEISQSWSISLALTLLAFHSARAQEVIVSCDSELSWAYVSEANVINRSVILEGRQRTKSIIDTTSLPISSEPEKLSVNSVGKVKTSTCGPFTLVFSTIPFSSADVASAFSVWEAGERVLGPLALGSCQLSEGAWGECPSEWVTSATLRWDEPGRPYAFSLEHAFQEFRPRSNRRLQGTPDDGRH